MHDELLSDTKDMCSQRWVQSLAYSRARQTFKDDNRADHELWVCMEAFRVQKGYSGKVN